MIRLGLARAVLSHPAMKNRTPQTWSPDVQLKLADEKCSITPRDHQLAAWDRLSAHFIAARKQGGMVVVPTGGGKTVLAAHWLLENHIRNGGRVLWLAHKRTLLRQAFNTFRFLGNVARPKPALNLIAISSEDCRWNNVSPEHDAIFSSMQTAVLEGNNSFVVQMVEDSPKGVYVVVDEAHHAAAPGYAALVKQLRSLGCRVLGLTATPVRMDEDDQKLLVWLFRANEADASVDAEVPIFQVSRRELTEKNILAVPSFETVKTQVNLEKDFTENDYRYLSRFNELGPEVLRRLSKNAGRNGLIVDHYLKHREKFGPTIVFAADTLHAVTLAEEFQKKGVQADYVDYTRGDAQTVIQQYREQKKPDVLVNVEMLTEGFDAPHTRTVFIARPTRSEALLTQMVGRALRGRQANGNDMAYLVTFLDTWEQFNVLDAEYVLGLGEEVAATVNDTGVGQRVTIPIELVREAYRLLQSNIKGQLTGVFQCLPHGWYVWEQTFDDDQQRRTVMVYEHQLDGFQRMLEDHADVSAIPEEIDENLAREYVRRYFADSPDPLPRWTDLKALLDARKKGCEVSRYTFDEKAAFDPTTVAKSIVEKNLGAAQKKELLQGIWDASPACGFVYRSDFRAFVEDVARAEVDITSERAPDSVPDIVEIVPRETVRPWASEEHGYSLVALRDAVLSVKKHFPNGAPVIGDLVWSSVALKKYWGFCRYSDKSITINCALNSPDVPLFVMEYLMFHEMLHADMPSAGHNRDFRQREWTFQPSAEAEEDAARRGIKTSSAKHGWFVRADAFLGTFERYYAMKRPGSSMDM